MAERMYSETPEARFVEAARTIIPSGVASDPPVNIEKIAANVVPDPVAGKILTAVKSEDGTTVMKWDDGVESWSFQDEDRFGVLAYIRLDNEFDVENYLDFLFVFDTAKFQEDFAGEIEAWYERGFEQYAGQSIAYDLYMTILTEMILFTKNALFSSYLITKKYIGNPERSLKTPDENEAKMVAILHTDVEVVNHGMGIRLHVTCLTVDDDSDHTNTRSGYVSDFTGENIGTDDLVLPEANSKMVAYETEEVRNSLIYYLTPSGYDTIPEYLLDKFDITVEEQSENGGQE